MQNFQDNELMTFCKIVYCKFVSSYIYMQRYLHKIILVVILLFLEVQIKTVFSCRQ